jgi:FlaA1/EpsC-like NDP-sugar epimerase
LLRSANLCATPFIKNHKILGITVKSARIFIATIGLTCLVSNALACGDSLYRVGKGIAYRTYSAPLPGNLLIFGSTDGANALAEQLAASGHGVNVAGSLDELTTELGRGCYDVVIAPFDARQAIQSTGASTSYLPVTFSREEEREAKQSHDQVMLAEKHEIKHFLKAIHRSLRDQSFTK